MFIRGREYNRRQDLHGSYGGQQQGGICTPKSVRAIFLFTGGSGTAHGYDDGWLPSGVFRYFGEGQAGDMQFVRGNQAIRDHAATGKALHLFAESRRGHVRYEGEMTCGGFEFVPGAPDTNNASRTAIAFHLVPVSDSPPLTPDAEVQAADELSPTTDLDTLRSRAYDSRPQPTEPTESLRKVHRRTRIVRTYVLRRAAGTCEGCAKPAPFLDKIQQPFLEAHHVSMLSDGGPDLPNAVIALCPDCHRRVHYGIDGDAFNEGLRAQLLTLEPADTAA